MFRRAPRRHPRSFSLSLQPLEPRHPMAGDFSLTLDGDAVAITADDAKYAEVSLHAKGPAVAPPGDLSKTPLLDQAGKHAGHVVDLHDRMQEVVAVKEAEQAGLSRDVERESRLVDPTTGDALAVGRGKATAVDSTFAGRDGVDPWSKGKSSSVTDPLTGQPLLGGGGGGGTSPSNDDALAAGMAGRSRAMDDPWVVTNDNEEIFGKHTFGYLHGTGAPYGEEGVVVTNYLTGSKATYWSASSKVVYEDGRTEHQNIVKIRYEEAGKKPYVIEWQRTWTTKKPQDKPRPDDDGNAAPRQLTDVEKQAILRELRGSFGPAGKPRPDDDGAGVGGSVGEMLTDLDLAGQPRWDDEGHRGGVAPAGPVLTGVGLAGQPVDDDTNFGVVIVGGGGLEPPGPRFG